MRRILTSIIICTMLFLSGCGADTADTERFLADPPDSPVAVLSVYAYDGHSETSNLIACYGHAFLGLENISDRTLSLYNYQLEPGEALTVSWWAVDRHMGIWFNMESNYLELHGRYADRWSVSRAVSAEELEALTAFMAANDHYTPLSNCSKNVTDCWNTIAQDSERLAVYTVSTPERLKDAICAFPEAEHARELPGGGISYYSSDSDTFVEYEMEAQADA